MKTLETISFVSVLYNHPVNLIQRMIDSIDNVMQYCPYFDYKIILWDNNNGKTLSLSDFRSISNLVIGTSENLGYCGGNNRAIGISDSKYIIVINPDIIIENSLAIDWMIGTSKMHNCISGRLIGTIDWYTYTSSFPTDKKYDPKELPFFYDQPTLIRPGNWRPFKYIDGCFMCFPRNLWEEIKGFDEAIHPGYFGENVFCFKSFLKGYTIKDCNVSNLFSHSSIPKPPVQLGQVRKWSEEGRRYFYENYALTNWDKFLEYLNM